MGNSNISFRNARSEIAVIYAFFSITRRAELCAAAQRTRPNNCVKSVEWHVDVMELEELCSITSITPNGVSRWCCGIRQVVIVLLAQNPNEYEIMC